MTVQDTGTIDHITLSEDEFACNLPMVEDRPFTGSPAQHEQLREKMNTYLTFVQTGQLVEHFPDLAGKRMAVRLVCHEEPGEESVVQLLEAAAALLARHGADFSIEVIPWEMI